MTLPHTLARLLPTTLLGAAVSWALLLLQVPPPVLLIVGGAAFIVLLPRHPRAVTAFTLGAVASLGVLGVVWAGGWGCASEVDGVLVEHDCGETPYRG